MSINALTKGLLYKYYVPLALTVDINNFYYERDWTPKEIHSLTIRNMVHKLELGS